MVTRGKFGVTDFQVARLAADRALPVVTANVKMAAQVAGFPLLRSILKALPIHAIGPDVKAGADLATLIP